MGVTLDQVLGRLVREERERQRISQAELGRALGQYLGKPWPRQTISAAEKGGRPWRAVELAALSLILNVDWWEIEENVQFPSGRTARVKDIDFGDLSLDLVDELGGEITDTIDALHDLGLALGEVRQAITQQDDDPGIGAAIEIIEVKEKETVE